MGYHIVSFPILLRMDQSPKKRWQNQYSRLVLLILFPLFAFIFTCTVDWKEAIFLISSSPSSHKSSTSSFCVAYAISSRNPLLVSTSPSVGMKLRFRQGPPIAAIAGRFEDKGIRYISSTNNNNNN